MAADQDAAVLAVDAELDAGEAVVNLRVVDLHIARQVHMIEQLHQHALGQLGHRLGVHRSGYPVALRLAVRRAGPERLE
jgi:hypothetical protein